MAGGQPFSPRLLEHVLLDRLGPTGAPGRLRLIRVEGSRALVEVPHTIASRAREAWNGEWTTDRGFRWSTTTTRTFGTLRKGKSWLRRIPQARAPEAHKDSVESPPNRPAPAPKGNEG